MLLALCVLAISVPALATAAARSEGDSDAAVVATGKAARTVDGYIVRMLDQPVVAYTGGIPGLKATKPANGKRIDDCGAPPGRHLEQVHHVAIAVEARRFCIHRQERLDRQLPKERLERGGRLDQLTAGILTHAWRPARDRPRSPRRPSPAS